MNGKSILFGAALVLGLGLSACGPRYLATSSSSGTEATVNFLTPTGSPALAFYDQGNNPNWTSTSVATSIPAAFAAGKEDAIVFDGANGLNVIRKNGYDYKLARWISGGNFYLVSTTREAGDPFVGESAKILAFNQTGNASLSFNKLAKDYWGWDYLDSQVTYLDGVQQVMQALVANPGNYDYYVIAEPVLTNAKGQLSANGISLNTVYDLQAEWKAAGYGPSIPAAALFFNTKHYEKKKAAMDSFLEATLERIDTAIADPEEVVEVLGEYGSDDEVQARFGFRPAQVTSLQGNGENRFGLFGSEAELGGNDGFANSFWTALGNEPFEKSLFL